MRTGLAQGPRFTDGKFPISDTFTRADSTTTLGTTEVGGKTWEVTGTWGINTNRAYRIGTSGTVECAVVDSGIADHHVEATMGATSNGGLVARFVDASNYYWTWRSSTTRMQVYKVVGGVSSYLFFQDHSVSLDGVLVGLSVKGNLVSLFMNGAFVGSATDSSLSSGTKAGMAVSWNTLTHYFDDFSLREAS